MAAFDRRTFVPVWNFGLLEKNECDADDASSLALSALLPCAAGLDPAAVGRAS